MCASVDSPSAADVSAEWTQWLETRRQQVDTALTRHLRRRKSKTPPHERLMSAVEYSVGGGGKRLRPILVLETCGVCGGTDAAAMPAALAVECVHAFSLIHDDLPAMDDDDLRRGRPTNHKVFGEALAILSGDWLLAEAFFLISSDSEDGAVSAEVVRTLAWGALGMVEGQVADIEASGRPADGSLVRYIHEHKTADLIEACCRIGALCAKAPAAQVAAIAEYGRRLGLAFQIVDDVLDCTSDTKTLGKRVGKDADDSKQTYPAAFGLEESRARSRLESDAAVAALQPFGACADRLRGLARFVIARDR